MKIYSDFKDYYDCGMRYGQSHIVYNRKRTVIGDVKSCNDNSMKIFFCDKLYYVYHESRFNDAWNKREPKGILVQCKINSGMRHNYYIEQSDKPTNTNQTEKSPIVVSYGYDKNRKWSRVINEHLGKFEFYKVIDPISAFQQIEMWIGANLTAEKPIPQIDDKTMRDIKGFDKSSFKKPKS